jgi:hypothetical protein
MKIPRTGSHLSSYALGRIEEGGLRIADILKWFEGQAEGQAAK